MQQFYFQEFSLRQSRMYKDSARIMFITALFKIVGDDNLYTIVIG